MRISEGKISEITEKLSMYDVVSEYVDLKPKGNRYWGLCPFHTEKTPSFTVNEEKKMFYCFGCHKGGSMFSFVSEMEKISFPDAVKKLADKAGITLKGQVESKEDKKYQAMMELYNRLVKSFHYILINTDQAAHAREYLAKRGIDDSVIKVFNLGYVPDDRFWIYNFLRSKKYSSGFLTVSGLFSSKNPEISLFSNRIMFPVVDQKGNTIAFSGRQLGTFGGKYINTPETFFYKKRKMVFGLYTAIPEIKLKKEFVLVEGNFDVLALFQAGVKNVVAPLGTAFTEDQAKLLRKYSRKCIIFYDQDSAGLQATVKTAAILEKLGMENSVIEPLGGEDPADILEKQGAEALNKLLKYPISTFEYIVKKAIDLHDVESPEGKRSVFDFVAPYVASFESAIKRDGYLKELADRLDISVDAVFNDFSTTRFKKSEVRPDAHHVESMGNKSAFFMTPDLYFIISVASHLSVFSKVRNWLSLEDFSDSNARDIFIAMEDLYRRDELTIDYLLERITDYGLRKIVNEKILSGEFDLNFDTILADGIRNVKIKALEKKRDSVVILLKKAEMENNLEDVKQLLMEKIYLDEELNRVKVSENV